MFAYWKVALIASGACVLSFGLTSSGVFAQSALYNECVKSEDWDKRIQACTRYLESNSKLGNALLRIWSEG